VKYSI